MATSKSKDSININIGGGSSGLRVVGGVTVGIGQNSAHTDIAESKRGTDFNISSDGAITNSDIIAAGTLRLDSLLNVTGSPAHERAATETLPAPVAEAPAPKGKAKREPAPVPAAEVSGDFLNSPEARATLKELRGIYETQMCSDDPHHRGYVLQELFTRLFTLNRVPVLNSFTRNDGGEQIDGAFIMDSWHYVVECRWRAKLADIRQLDGLKGQVDRAGKQTLGIYLSINGWSKNVEPLLKQNPEKSIFLVDGADIHAVLKGEISLRNLLLGKLAALNLRSEPYASVEQLSAISRQLAVNQ